VFVFVFSDNGNQIVKHFGVFNVRPLSKDYIVQQTTTNCEVREKTNKMQQLDVLLSTLSQHVSGIIMPIFRRTKTVCYCMWCNALVLLDVVDSGCGVRTL